MSEREKRGGDDIGELNQRGGRIMEGGRETDKEGERRERRDGKKEIRGKGRACSRGEE